MGLAPLSWPGHHCSGAPGPRLCPGALANLGASWRPSLLHSTEFKNSFNKYLLKANYAQGDQIPSRCLPVLSLLQNVRGFSLCRSSALTIPLRLSFPEEAFIQSSLGGHVWGPGMEALPVRCFPVLEVQQGVAVPASG